MKYTIELYANGELQTTGKLSDSEILKLVLLIKDNEDYEEVK
jgi:hypothetical protein